MASAVLPVLYLHPAAGLFLICLSLITAEVELFFICLLAVCIFSSLSWPLCFWKEGWVSKGHWKKDVTVIIISEPWGGEVPGRELRAPWDSWGHSLEGLFLNHSELCTANYSSMLVLRLSVCCVKNASDFWEGAFYLAHNPRLTIFPRCACSRLGFSASSWLGHSSPVGDLSGVFHDPCHPARSPVLPSHI